MESKPSDVERQVFQGSDEVTTGLDRRHTWATTIRSKLDELIKNSIIGFADGLTVPFALTAGLSSIGSSRIVILGGLAELFSGAISMGLGAYLASVTERKHYDVEREKKHRDVEKCPEVEEARIYDIFSHYGTGPERARSIVESLQANRGLYVKFMMDFELKLERPNRRFAFLAALAMGLSYLLGGLIPMIPYFATPLPKALYISIGVAVVTLLIFGYVKAVVTGTTQRDACWSAVQTLLIGAAAAAVSYGIVRGVNSAEPGEL
ncbi:Ccc1 family [Lineolata rhizophorae]|uniref:Ccc1 family n=1 Tax=Lineolata rhizophorae TaxID=578093 RepID=A0A6A6NSY4_9PEZI|nr:Ccc1 family [Lineolata rhizophorae]